MTQELDHFDNDVEYNTHLQKMFNQYLRMAEESKKAFITNRVKNGFEFSVPSKREGMTMRLAWCESSECFIISGEYSFSTTMKGQSPREISLDEFQEFVN